MKDLVFNSKFLINFQRWLWRAVFIYFLITTSIYIFDRTLGDELTFYGIILLFIGTFVKLMIFAVNFQKTKLYRFSLLSYLLIFILASTVILKYWIL